MLTLITLALAVASASAHSISHVHRRHAQVVRATAPEGWATGYLEPYDTYHTRYLAIDCEAKHNTSFFNMCCHPLLATETLAENRNACCAPGATVACPGEVSSLVATASKTSSAAAASATADEDEDCDDGDDEDDTGDDEDCEPEDDGDDGDDEDCSDDGDDVTSSAVSTKVAATSAPPAVAAVPKTTAKTSTTSSTEVTPTTTSTKAQPTTTSTEAQPTTTSTEAQPTTTPKPTTTTTTKTSTTQKATTATTAQSSAFTGGFGTWFTQNGVAGACGTVHPDSAKIVALQTEKYDNGANCGRTVQIKDLNNGKTTTATVADECPTCTNSNCLDMSEGLFEFFEDLSVGEMNIEWFFTD